MPCEEWKDGYMSQQFYKMVADLYCVGDYISFIDSDSMVVRDTDLLDLSLSGRPVITYLPYAELNPEIHGQANGWIQVMKEVLMLSPELEFMRGIPYVYRRDTIANCRNHLERLHGKSIEDIIRTRPAREFSEFNTLGLFAYCFERDRYEFIHEKKIDWRGITRQFHSYTQWNDDTPTLLAKLLEES